MRTLLVNPPYQTITSNWGVGHQVPLGLLMVGGAVRDAGYEVSLLDAGAGHLRHEQIAAHVQRTRPDVVMTGHADGDRRVRPPGPVRPPAPTAARGSRVSGAGGSGTDHPDGRS